MIDEGGAIAGKADDLSMPDDRSASGDRNAPGDRNVSGDRNGAQDLGNAHDSGSADHLSMSGAHGSAEDLSRPILLSLAALILVLLAYFYWPSLTGKADFYLSDLTYYFEPFCTFVRNELHCGRIPLWNPYLYSGMPQLAMPSPGLLYPLSWLMFLFPFSVGLSLYMMAHQALFGAGAYLYLRDQKASRAASIYAAAVLVLCAYEFAFVRNITLPASMAWLPIGLYCERKIRTGNRNLADSNCDAPADSSDSARVNRFLFLHMMGLAISVGMIVHVGRPEVGVPELLLLGIAAITRPVLALMSGGKTSAEWQSTFFKLTSLGLGVALGLPAIVPGIEWTALSPRAQGMALKWVLMWSSNWYDYLSMVLSQPLGDLYVLDEHTAELRRLVLSRGGYIPFLSSTYISPIVVTMAIWGLSDRQNKMRWFTVLLLIGFVLMAAGTYTPFAPAFVKLSPMFATFRYPIKLMIFPMLLMLLLAVRGLDLLLLRRLSQRVLGGTVILWGLVLVAAICLATMPHIVEIASNWRWLFHKAEPLPLLREAQFKMAGSMIYSACLTLIACLAAYFVLWGKVRARNGVVFITLLTCGTLIHSSVTYRRITPHGFYEHPSAVAEKIKQYERERIANRAQPEQSISSSKILGVDATRVLNLYFDPLTVPPKYNFRNGLSFDENFFQYSRELLLYNTVLCSNLPSSYGYEAAETGDYRECFTEAFAAGSQCHREAAAKSKSTISDAPTWRFSELTASQYINTQLFRTADGDLPKLDKKYFQLLNEDRALNFRIYRAKFLRPRIYFTSNLCYVENFNDLQKVLSTTTDVAQTRSFDASPDLTYLLNRDFKKYKEQLKQITQSKLPQQADKIELLEDTGQQMRLAVSCNTSRLLVIADHFYPGWLAELDGKPADILRANIFNKSILIPPGSHQLKVFYYPRSLLLGSTAALASLLVFILGFFAISRTKRKELHQGATASKNAAASTAATPHEQSSDQDEP